MGWSYRKSIHVGPFRVNLSKSGVGYSIGEKDFRVGVNARGRRYTSVTIPGTGITYRSSGRSRSKSGCAPILVALAFVFALAIYRILSFC